MSTTAWRIIQLVTSLPPQEQAAIRRFLAHQTAAPNLAKPPFRDWEAEEGLPNDDPFFQRMEEVEQERRALLPRPQPEMD